MLENGKENNIVTDNVASTKVEKDKKRKNIGEDIQKENDKEMISSSFKTVIIYFGLITIIGLGVVCSAQKEQIKILNSRIQTLEFTEENNQIQMTNLQKDSDKLNKIKEILK